MLAYVASAWLSLSLCEDEIMLQNQAILGLSMALDGSCSPGSPVRRHWSLVIGLGPAVFGPFGRKSHIDVYDLNCYDDSIYPQHNWMVLVHCLRQRRLSFIWRPATVAHCIKQGFETLNNPCVSLMYRQEQHPLPSTCDLSLTQFQT